MSSNPVYNLTWGEYGTSLISAVQLLRCHDELIDVTLAAGGRTFHAHKVVLCAASPFLLDLLKSTTCKHPVVMLAGVQASDLEALLEFVYRGEVSVDPNQLPSLLQAAHCLNIQGLAPTSNLNEECVPKTDGQKTQFIQSTDVNLNSDDTTLKRKKRAKRLKSPVQSNKWSKVFMQTEIHGNIIDSQQDNTSNSWVQHMNLNMSASPMLGSLPIQSPVLLQNVPVAVNNTNLTTKIRGASDQPGACPLCGAMLRQARNLRRHLITSCKYRTINGQQINTTQDRTTNTQLHELQTMSMQNIDRIAQSIENKTMGLTPISCGELLPPTSSLMQSNSLH